MKRKIMRVLSGLLFLTMLMNVLSFCAILASASTEYITVMPDASIATSNGGGIDISLLSPENTPTFLHINVPANFEVIGIPDKTDEMIGRYIAGISINGDETTGTVVEYEFISTMIAVGFSVIVRPSMKLENNSKHDVSFTYIYGANAESETAVTTVTVINSSLQGDSSYFNASRATEMLRFGMDSDNLSERSVYVPYRPHIYFDTSKARDHYQYAALQLVVPLGLKPLSDSTAAYDESIATDAVFKNGDTYTSLEEGAEYFFTNSNGESYGVEYYSAYNLINWENGPVAYSGPVLRYTLLSGNSLVSGEALEFVFDNSNINISYKNIPNGTYLQSNREQICVYASQDSSPVSILYGRALTSNYASVYLNVFTRGTYSLHTSSTVTSKYSYPTTLVGIKDSTSLVTRLTSANATPVTEITFRYDIPYEAGMTQFKLSNNAARVGSNKTLTYKYTVTNASGETRSAEVSKYIAGTVEEALSIESIIGYTKGEYITELTVQYDIDTTTGTYRSVPNGLTDGIIAELFLWNAAGAAGESTFSQRLISINGEPQDIAYSERVFVRQQVELTYPTTPVVSPTSVKIDDLLTLRFFPTNTMTVGATYKPRFYILVPYGYEYVPGSYKTNMSLTSINPYTDLSSVYTIAEKPVTGQDGKLYTLYTIAYTDNTIRRGYSPLEMSFRVTEFVDVSAPNVTFPAGFYFDNGYDTYLADTGKNFTSQYSSDARYVYTDVLDLAGTGDVGHTMAKPASLPSLALSRTFAFQTGHDTDKPIYSLGDNGIYTVKWANTLQENVSDVKTTVALPRIASGAELDVSLIGSPAITGRDSLLIKYGTSADEGSFVTAGEVANWSAITHIELHCETLYTSDLVIIKFPFTVTNLVNNDQRDNLGQFALNTQNTVRGVWSFNQGDPVDITAASNFVKIINEGAILIGDVLELSMGDKLSSATAQWYVNGEAISGATGKTYKVTRADAGKEIYVVLSKDGYSYKSNSVYAIALDPLLKQDAAGSKQVRLSVNDATQINHITWSYTGNSQIAYDTWGAFVNEGKAYQAENTAEGYRTKQYSQQDMAGLLTGSGVISLVDSGWYTFILNFDDENGNKKEAYFTFYVDAADFPYLYQAGKTVQVINPLELPDFISAVHYSYTGTQNPCNNWDDFAKQGYSSLFAPVSDGAAIKLGQSGWYNFVLQYTVDGQERQGFYSFEVSYKLFPHLFQNSAGSVVLSSDLTGDDKVNHVSYVFTGNTPMPYTTWGVFTTKGKENIVVNGINGYRAAYTVSDGHTVLLGNSGYYTFVMEYTIDGKKYVQTYVFYSDTLLTLVKESLAVRLSSLLEAPDTVTSISYIYTGDTETTCVTWEAFVSKGKESTENGVNGYKAIYNSQTPVTDGRRIELTHTGWYTFLLSYTIEGKKLSTFYTFYHEAPQAEIPFELSKNVKGIKLSSSLKDPDTVTSISYIYTGDTETPCTTWAAFVAKGRESTENGVNGYKAIYNSQTPISDGKIIELAHSGWYTFLVSYTADGKQLSIFYTVYHEVQQPEGLPELSQDGMTVILSSQLQDPDAVTSISYAYTGDTEIPFTTWAAFVAAGKDFAENGMNGYNAIYSSQSPITDGRSIALTHSGWYTFVVSYTADGKKLSTFYTFYHEVPQPEGIPELSQNGMTVILSSQLQDPDAVTSISYAYTGDTETPFTTWAAFVAAGKDFAENGVNGYNAIYGSQSPITDGRSIALTHSGWYTFLLSYTADGKKMSVSYTFFVE